MSETANTIPASQKKRFERESAILMQPFQVLTGLQTKACSLLQPRRS